jgi:hypothetical protein
MNLENKVMKFSKFVIFFATVVIMTLSFTSCVSLGITKKGKAVQIAAEYLSKKYSQRMNYLSIYNNWIRGAYNVYFSPENNPEIEFSVIIFKDLRSPAGYTSTNGTHFEPDNYLIAIFEHEAKKLFHDRIKRLCQKVIDLYVIVPNNSSVFITPIELVENMEYNIMEIYLDYNIIIIMENLDKNNDASCILEIINSIKETGFTPVGITFRTEPYDREKVIRIENWNDIGTLDEIYILKTGYATN